MRAARLFVATFALLAALLMMPGRAQAQGAVAFQPSVGQIPDGVSLNVAPVVTADRRYVRLSLNANFSTINGFSNFPVPGAVSGGNGTGGLRGGLGGLGGGLGGLGGGTGAGGAGGAGGGNAVGGGFRNVGPGPWLADSGVPYSPEYLEASRKAAAQAKPDPAKPARGKKALADPVMVPMKKPKAGAVGVPRG